MGLIRGLIVPAVEALAGNNNNKQQTGYNNNNNGYYNDGYNSYDTQYVPTHRTDAGMYIAPQRASAALSNRNDYYYDNRCRKAERRVLRAEQRAERAMLRADRRGGPGCFSGRPVSCGPAPGMGPFGRRSPGMGTYPPQQMGPGPRDDFGYRGQQGGFVDEAIPRDMPRGRDMDRDMGRDISDSKAPARSMSAGGVPEDAPPSYEEAQRRQK